MSRRPSPPRARSSAVPGAGPTTAPSRPARSRAAGTGPESTRPASRPAAKAAPTDRASDGGVADRRAPDLARIISVRTLVLGVVLLVGFTMLFPTIRAYLGQRAGLDALAAEVVAAEQAERDLQSELDRWADPAYVATQARERLSFALPGETSYRVIDPEVVVETTLMQGAAPGPVAGPALPAGGAMTPWYATVWESVRLAGQSPMPDPGPPAAPVGGVAEPAVPAAPAPGTDG